MKTTKRLILILCCSLAIGGINAQTATFNYTGATQNWTVPCGVTSVTVDVRGAQGGTYGAATGGLGARIQGTLTVVPSNVLTIYVGGQGTASENAGGGGGGSGIANSGTPLVVAGGGGGGSEDGVVGMPGLTGTTGGSSSGPGGTAGNGGDKGYTSGDCGWAGGGGGFLGNGYGGNGTWDGGSLPGTLGGTAAGFSATNGGTGGSGGGCQFSALGSGGWGCGGGGRGEYGGGGGGGYSGGGGGQYTPTPSLSPGGGGGSYNTGGSQTNTQGFQSGNGQVILTWTSTALSISGNIIQNVSCNGGSNGSASGIITGGGSPFTYSWTPSGGTRDTANGLSAGSYTINVTDACGHTASASVAITQPLVLAATATTSTNVTCNGGSTGATASTVTGGTTPYTYTWTGGSTNATASGLTAGSYTLNVTDKNGCSATASTVVTQPNALSDSAFTITNVLCNAGSGGSASNIASGGSAPYTYSWTPGGGTTDTATGLTAGTYSLMVSDACGASATASVSITQPTAISITSHSTPDNGHGVGTAKVTVSGGVGPYTYLWTPGGKTTDSIGGLTKGTYCCDVKDANGCKDTLCVVVKPTGIDGINDNSAQIVVYPNPNNGQFTIESSVGGASSVEIYNILGEKVFTRNLSTTKGTNTINVSNQPNGVYLYRIISDNGNLLGEGRISIQK